VAPGILFSLVVDENGSTHSTERPYLGLGIGVLCVSEQTASKEAKVYFIGTPYGACAQTKCLIGMVLVGVPTE